LTPVAPQGILNALPDTAILTLRFPMPLRRYDRSFSELVQPDEAFQHIIPEQQESAECPHGIEFWVAVRTVHRDGSPIVMQWCMRCQSVEVLTHEAYAARQAANAGHVCEYIPGWWEE
jgi:hypothetical protein